MNPNGVTVIRKMDMWDGRSRDGVGPMNTVFRGCGGIGSVGMGFGLTVGSFALLNGLLLEFLNYPASV